MGLVYDINIYIDIYLVAHDKLSEDCIQKLLTSTVKLTTKQQLYLRIKRKCSGVTRATDCRSKPSLANKVSNIYNRLTQIKQVLKYFSKHKAIFLFYIINKTPL
jgi:hypothetical protein